jgi:dienelactone hydrolase
MPNEGWQPIEQPAGPPLVKPVEPAGVEAHRAEVYQGYERFLRARLHELSGQRETLWKRDYSTADAYLRSVEPMRQRFKEMLGFWIERAQRGPVKTRQRDVLFEDGDFRAERFFLEFLPGLETYAVELIPKSPGKHPGLLVQHGYGGTPELACGLTANSNADDYSYRSMGIRAVRRGFHVMAPLHPTSYGSPDEVSSRPPPGSEQQNQCYGKNRLHRMALLAGGSLIGLDMMGTSRAIDLLMAAPDVDANRVGLYGLSQGGMTGLYLPTMDQRIRATVCSAWFTSRLSKMIGPHPLTTFLDYFEEDKFLPELISHFQDDDLVSLIAPRAFAVEAGMHDSSVDFDSARKAFALAHEHYRKLGIPERSEFIAHEQGHVSATARAFDFLSEQLK